MGPEVAVNDAPVAIDQEVRRVAAHRVALRTGDGLRPAQRRERILRAGHEGQHVVVLFRNAVDAEIHDIPSAEATDDILEVGKLAPTGATAGKPKGDKHDFATQGSERELRLGRIETEIKSRRGFGGRVAQRPHVGFDLPRRLAEFAAVNGQRGAGLVFRRRRMALRQRVVGGLGIAGGGGNLGAQQGDHAGVGGATVGRKFVEQRDGFGRLAGPKQRAGRLIILGECGAVGPLLRVAHPGLLQVAGQENRAGGLGA